MDSQDGVRSARPWPERSRSSSMNTTTITPGKAPSSPVPTLPSIYPPPAYVATAAASQFVMDAHLHAMQTAEDPFTHSSAHDDILFSDGALAQINAFLDHLLYNFLSSSQSTKLAPIQIAVENVLKGKMGRLAISRAQTDLESLLDDEEDEELDGEDDAPSWNAEKYFLRTRLRIMVYMRLGEMEDEDEDDFVHGLIEEGEISVDEDEDDGLISPSGAIFLTSILEYVAEACLGVAGQAAYKRATSKRAVQSPVADSPTTTGQRLSVLEHDVEKAGFDARLGRLWRSWKHKMRGPSYEHTRNVSNLRSGVTSRKTSMSTLRSEIMATPITPIEQPQFPAIGTSNAPSQTGKPGTESVKTFPDAREPTSAETQEAVRVWRVPKQRPASLDLHPWTGPAEGNSTMTQKEWRSMQRRLRAMTLPAAGTIIPESAPLDRRLYYEQRMNDLLARSSNSFQNPNDLGVDSDEDPPTSPLPRALSSHPVAASSERDFEEAEYSPGIIDRARAVSITHPPRTDSAPLDSPGMSSAYKTPGIGTEPSPGSSSRTSFEDGPTRPNSMAPHKHISRSVASDGPKMHSATAMRLKNDAFPRLETAFPIMTALPSTTASPIGPQGKSSLEQSRPSTDETQRGWVRRLSNASKRSRSNSKNATATSIRRPSKETLASSNSSGRVSREQSIAERPFSELIADRGLIKLKLTPTQLERLEDSASPARSERHALVNGTIAQPSEPTHVAAASTLNKIWTTPPTINEAPPVIMEESANRSPMTPLSASRTVPTTPKPNKAGLVPKEARALPEPLDDFAHFIRNTGPAGKSTTDISDVAPAPFASRGIKPASSYKTLSRRTTVENLRSPPPTKTSFSEVIPPMPLMTPKKTRSGFAPREPTTERRSPNADLIDFLRAGPPPGTVSATVVAQSQSSPAQGPPPTRYNVRTSDVRTDGSGSVRSSSLMTQSLHGSVNSHSALLASPSRNQMRTDAESSPLPVRTDSATPRTIYQNRDPWSVHSESQTAVAKPIQEEESTGKTQYRNKDPYALPSDDDEEGEDLIAPVKKPKRAEESFIDFLRQVEPPSHTTPSPFLANENGSSVGLPTSYSQTSYTQGLAAPTGHSYVDHGHQATKLRKEKSGSMRNRIFGKTKVGAN